MLRHTDQDIEAAGRSIGVGYAEMAAVVHVEARKTGFVGDHLQILYEPHIAWRELGKDASGRRIRKQLHAEGLAYPKWRRNYPKTPSARHDQLARAIAIAGDRAYRWISMGMPQIMGFNAKIAGYPNAKAMFDAFVSKGETEQIAAMARFIRDYRDGRALRALKARDWDAFALVYNGKGYRKNRYHTKLARWFNHYRNRTPVDPWADGMLSMGDKGAPVRELQSALNIQGAGLTLDGDFGPMTAQAVEDWHRRRGSNDVSEHVTRMAFDNLMATVSCPKPKPSPSKPASGGLIRLLISLIASIFRRN